MHGHLAGNIDQIIGDYLLGGITKTPGCKANCLQEKQTKEVK